MYGSMSKLDEINNLSDAVKPSIGRDDSSSSSTVSWDRRYSHRVNQPLYRKAGSFELTQAIRAMKPASPSLG